MMNRCLSEYGVVFEYGIKSASEYVRNELLGGKERPCFGWPERTVQEQLDLFDRERPSD